MELILHNNVRSMFSEKVRRVLAFKGLDWSDVQVPGLPPKTHFVPLTGGYRRMPVLQIGADIYCDSALILRKLEEIAPAPAVFPPSASGTAQMIADWADHRAALWSIIAVFPDFLAQATPEFIKDRTALVADFAPDRVAVLAPHMVAQIAQFALMVDQALAAHAFVAGPDFSVADAACYHVLWFAKFSPRVFAGVAAFPRVVDWMARIAAFPAPQVTPKEPTYALEVARAAQPADVGDTVAEGEPLQIGQIVAIAADDYAKEQIVGEIVKLTSDEIALRQHNKQVGEIAIHFPRLGFAITPAALDQAVTQNAAVAEKLKEATRLLPSGVAIVTTRDGETGQSVGMAVSSMISVSMDPPTMLVAINRNSANHAAFARAPSFCINLLNTDHCEEVGIFASGHRREERFASDGWQEAHGLDYLAGATAILCSRRETLEVGTHEIFIGEVFEILAGGQSAPLGWLKGGFHALAPLNG